MKKVFSVMICLAIVCSFVSCSTVKFEESENQTIVAKDGTEYSLVGYEGNFWCFGKWDFIGHVKGEKKLFFHMSVLGMKTGMYSVNGQQDVLVRYFPHVEFAAIYVKSDLLKTEISLENCIRFQFVKGTLFSETEPNFQKSITECEQFLTEIKSGQTAKDAGLYDSLRQPNGTLNNCYVYGYVCGIVQEDLNIVIPLQVMSFDDKVYSILIDGVEYVLPEEWLIKLIAE